MLHAKATEDAALTLGSAKELCETVAKVVVSARGGIEGSQADMPALVRDAHKALEFQPGAGLATDSEARQIAQGLKSIVLGVSELRNRMGTGHGRSTLPEVTAEHAELAYEAAVLWSGWALRRLEPYIAGDVTTLVRQLGEGAIFRRGNLAERLRLADLGRLTVEDQRRLGIAVARRAAAGTFVVREDGIEAVRAEQSQEWPVGYVEGLIVGMFVGQDGYIDLAPWCVREAARLIAALSDPEAAVKKLIAELADAAWPMGVSQAEEILAAFRESSEGLPPQVRGKWVDISKPLQDTGEEDGFVY